MLILYLLYLYLHIDIVIYFEPGISPKYIEKIDNCTNSYELWELGEQ